MNVVPVADESKNQQDKCDEQQPGRFRGVDGMAVMPVSRFVWDRHRNIVALRIDLAPVDRSRALGVRC